MGRSNTKERDDDPSFHSNQTPNSITAPLPNSSFVVKTKKTRISCYIKNFMTKLTFCGIFSSEITSASFLAFQKVLDPSRAKVTISAFLYLKMDCAHFCPELLQQNTQFFITSSTVCAEASLKSKKFLRFLQSKNFFQKHKFSFFVYF